MPDKLLIHPNERLDKVDLDYASAGYSEAMAKLDKKTLLVSRRALVANGFRLEVADQTISPGQITVHNGSYVDVTGKLVTNEQSLTSSQTITLLGANGTFYVELTFVDADGSLDDRAFWDTTFDNGVGAIKGKEYLQEVNTRTSTVWTTVSPVATTGFAFTSNEQSPKIPFAILKTDSLGRITTSVNAGLVDGPFATVIEDDVAAGANKIRVLDATLLANPGAHIIIGGSENKIISSVDRSSGIVLLTTTLSLNHARGSIVSNVGGTFYMHQRTGTTVEDTAGASTHPDKLRRMFSGNEDRGKALMSSAYSAGARDDLQLRSLKDQIDFLAAQLRELKVGGVTSALPSDFSASRYYDFVGSVQGSKQATYTVGNGTNTYGDFNGTDHTPFQAAHDAAVARGFTEVVIYVKAGVYTFTSSVTTTIPVKFICQSVGGTQTELFGNVTLFSSSARISFEGGYFFANNGLVNTTVTGVEVSLRNSLCQLGGSSYIVNTAATAYARLYMCTVSTLSNILIGPLVKGTISDCDITFQNGYVVNVTFAATIDITNTRFTCTGNGSVLNLNTATLLESNISNNIFSFTGATSTGSISKGESICVASTFNGNKITYDAMANTCNVLHFNTVNAGSWTNNYYSSTLAGGSDGTGTCLLAVQVANGLVFTGNEVFDASGGANEQGTFVLLHDGIVRRVDISNNHFFQGAIAVTVNDVAAGSGVIEIANNTSEQAQQWGIYVLGELSQVNVNDNIIKSTEGGGILVNATSGHNIHIDGNSIAQSAGGGAVDASAISVADATYVSVSGNTMDGTSLACTGASIDRASINASGINYLVWHGNHMFWNPVNSGTTGQGQIRWTNCVYAFGTGNIAVGYDGGSNVLWTGEETAGSAVICFVNNVIKGTATPLLQGYIISGTPSYTSTSVLTDANTYF